ncbi:glycine betaine carnitine choline ABC transporter [Latilactobacillus graminis DSM 20719]|uniref:Glycine betaine carnitine choline ABC transporter n=1 Tax=Latilactobacillus graminis DSM 20719 TaxID=1423752 RepID=A0AA89I6T1_9LACO|nr:glycine betaine carnitine choline ABC transporter [Latilactobacillus graminis DSM 20719]
MLSSCHSNGLGTRQSQPVRISSLSTTESQVLANILSELITHETHHKVTLINNLGSSTVTHESLIRGDADIAASRYAGTELTGTLKMKPTKDSKKAQQIVKKAFRERYDQKWFPSYGFADTYAFMVTQETAQKYHLETFSDLGKVAAKLTAGVDSVWVNHEGDGYPAFKHTYGYDFKKVAPMQIGLVYSALAAGKMDVVLGYSTDGRIKSYDLKVLKDDRHFFPPYDASVVATNQILKQQPDLAPLLHRLDGKINLDTMQTLNFKVDNDLLEPAVVAQQFLQEHHYFRKGAAK